MAIGRTFKESFQKSTPLARNRRKGLCRSSEVCRKITDMQAIRQGISIPTCERVFWLRHALLNGMTDEEIFDLCALDPWFIDQLRQLVEIELDLRKSSLEKFKVELMKTAKEAGFSDALIADLCLSNRQSVRKHREKLGLMTDFRLVDTCAAEFEAFTPYYYSSYGSENEISVSKRRRS